MPPPATSITPPDAPSTPPDSIEPIEEDLATPKLSPILPPPQLTIPQNAPSINNLSMPPPAPRIIKNTLLSPSISTLPPATRPRQKVVLAPGHSPLDWARLKSSSTDLRVLLPSPPPQNPFVGVWC